MRSQYEHQTMSRAARVLWIAVFASCTKPNPSAHCDDGVCIDPKYPYCDVSGAVTGEPHACTAVLCTASEFVTCDGDSAVTCSADASTYETTACEHGCNATTGGC